MKHDNRWNLPFRLIKSNNLIYVQAQFGSAEWFTLSNMENTGHNFKFINYRDFLSERDMLKWWKTANSTYILNMHVWMPSRGIDEYDYVCNDKDLTEKYPEDLI